MNLERLTQHLFGIVCVDCSHRRSLEDFHGCAKCGRPYCDDCLEGRRVCGECAGTGQPSDHHSIWLPSCVRDPGPSSNLDGYNPATVPGGDNPFGNQMTGVVLHSAEGYFGATAPSAVMRARGNSWCITIYQNGHRVQSYPLEALTWHAGPKANYRYIGIEHEGVAGQPLTGPQQDSQIIVLNEIRDIRGWANVQRGINGFEHNEFMATSCPSGRILWAVTAERTRRPVPTPVPSPAPAFVVRPRTGGVLLQVATNLVKLPEKTVVLALAAGTAIELGGETDFAGELWFQSRYSHERSIPNFFPAAATVAPTPPPPPAPTPAPIDPCADVKSELATISGILTTFKQELSLVRDRLDAANTNTANLQAKINAAKSALS